MRCNGYRVLERLGFGTAAEVDHKHHGRPHPTAASHRAFLGLEAIVFASVGLSRSFMVVDVAALITPCPGTKPVAGRFPAIRKSGGWLTEAEGRADL